MPATTSTAAPIVPPTIPPPTRPVSDLTHGGSDAEALRSHDNAAELLSSLQDDAIAPEFAISDNLIGGAHQNRLAMVRLGMASSLFYALRAKHPATAAHALRVALSVSAWSSRLKLSPEQRDCVEASALLVDIGKIGIPDRILRKPGKLDAGERSSMSLTPKIGVEILRGCTTDQAILDTVRYRHHWFAPPHRSSDSDDSGPEDAGGPIGLDIPLGSRMIAIAGAFDAMTTDSVYRRALSRESALGELFGGSGTQFDPELTTDFVQMLEDRPELLHGSVANRWLRTLDDRHSASLFAGPPTSDDRRSDRTSVSHCGDQNAFFEHWLDQADDGVVFTDAEGTIVRFNRRMSLLTGVQPDAVIGQCFDWASLRISLDNDADGGSSSGEALIQQIADSARSGISATVHSPGRGDVPVELRGSSIGAAGHYNRGMLLIVRDLSDEVTLQEELDSLHKKSVTDPLTKVANRAHFDETLDSLIDLSSRRGATLSLVMCDIDHFKTVNDVHGHQAGDEALVSFAQVLKSHAREGDLVSRYGGEEFLLLAPSCDIATMTRRAEAIRVALENTSLPSLKNESVTASFGVTELQSGDSAESIVARADRALMKAKVNGRNRVIQLGSGNSFEDAGASAKPGWISWFTGRRKQRDEFDIVTPVPVDLAIEKLRGFISDHNAQIVMVKENQLTLSVRAKVSRAKVGRVGRRRCDTEVTMRVSMTLSQKNGDGASRSSVVQTNVHCLIEPIRTRDRRGQTSGAAMRKVTDSLRSYLMGQIDPRTN